MHNQVSYDKMFDIMGVKELIIFEDTVSINNDKMGFVMDWFVCLKRIEKVCWWK